MCRKNFRFSDLGADIDFYGASKTHTIDTNGRLSLNATTGFDGAATVSFVETGCVIEVFGELHANYIPNVWEKAHGMDPHDPTDAAKDPDGDGVTSYEDFLYKK